MWHHGETIGFRTVIERFPDDRLTVVILANRDDLDPQALALQVAGSYLGHGYVADEGRRHDLRGLAAAALVALAPAALAAEAPARKGVETGDLDRSVAPCADFYEFANGAWRAQNPIPPVDDALEPPLGRRGRSSRTS